MIFAMLPPRRTVPALCALLLAGCTSHAAALSQPSAATPSTAPSVSAPSSAPPTVAARLAAPPVTPGELTRVVYTADPATMNQVLRTAARAGREYRLRVACVSSPPGQRIEYTILSSGPRTNTPLASSGVTCDNGPTGVSMPLPGTPIQIVLGPEMKGVTSAYAVVAPAASA
jgi:hypothetical protein